jgi:hypothetical protein
MAVIKKMAVRKACVAAVMAACASGALAVEIQMDNGWSGSWNTTLSVGASWRAEDADRKLVNVNNASRAHLGGVASNYNNVGLKTAIGNLNYQDAGDQYSEMYKVYTEISLTNGTVGGKISGKAWYDRVLNNEHVDFGAPNITTSAATSFAPAVGTVGPSQYKSRLSDEGASKLAKFDGSYLMDAYAFVNTEVAGMPLQVRGGRQAINWGESIFFQGVNQISPLDIGSLRRAGTEIKEALLPIWSLTANVGLPGGMSADFFYQFKWDPTELEACGTYWGVAFNPTTNPGLCNIFNTAAGSIASVQPAAGPQSPGLNIEVENGREGDNDGQFGVALKFPVDALDTEFGLYAMQINSRTPTLSLLPRATGTALGGVANTGSAVVWDYLDKIKIYGISAATTLGGISLAAELSYQQDVPVNLNFDDLDGGLLPGALYSVGGGTPLSRPDIQAAVTAAKNAGTRFKAYERFDKTQFQLNGVGTDYVVSKFLGAISGLYIAEVMTQWNNVPEFDPRKPGALRYGGHSSGVGSFTTASGRFVDTCATNYASAGTARPATGHYATTCKGDHYITDFAWGYKLRYSMDYPDVFGTGVTVTPSVFFAHDVEGVSMDTQLQEDRQTLSGGLRMNFQKVHDLQFNYTTYSGKWNQLSDRDNYSVAYSYTF